MLSIYVYQKCSTCRDALKWLDARGISYQVIAIRDTPPSVAELQTVATAMGGEIRRLFNTSGIDYREMGMKDKFHTMTEVAALELLSTHGNLVKRPFVIGDGVALVGFKIVEWERTWP
jgi:arsenate reductase (glutaredoxin)